MAPPPPPPPSTHQTVGSYSPPLSVTIIGGSLAGLFTAIALQSLPTTLVSSITILERLQPEGLQDLGAGIRCGNEAIAAIRKYASTPPEKYAALLSSYRFIDRDGNITAEQRGEMWTSTWAQIYRVLRARFDEEAGAGGRCRYRNGCTLTNLREQQQQEEEEWGRDSTVLVEFTNENNNPESLSTDLVIGADGPSSKTRTLLLPESTRYAVDYCCYRGVVPMEDFSPAARAQFETAGTFHWSPSSQVVSYAVPKNEGPAAGGERYVNWVWYQNRTPSEIQELLRDREGKQHRFSLPAKGMREEESQKIRKQARRELPPLHVEMVEKTEWPFVQVVTDSYAGASAFWGGRVLLVGDAVAGQRPHTASALMQGQYHAECLLQLLLGRIDLAKWEADTQSFSSILREKGRELGKVCMGDIPPEEKNPMYFKLFFGTQAMLNAKFKALDEIAGRSG